VRRLLNKIFGDVRKPGVISNLPSSASMSIREVQNQAIIGWLASRLEQLLSNQRDENDKPPAGVHHLSACLLEWIRQGEDVPERIKQLELAPDYKQSMTILFEEAREELYEIYKPVSCACISGSAGAQTASPSQDVWEVYRDVIYAATQKKLLLIDKKDVERYKRGTVLCEAPILERSDIPRARDQAKGCLIGIGFSPSDMMSHLLIISEAITNVLKHAEQGSMTLIQDGGEVRVVVEDKGQGFPLKVLPNATLMAGYSTKKSLGQGFTLMMKMAEQVLLATSPSGSTLILIMKRNEGEKHEQPIGSRENH
jgi:anti-sigma regulatory factor (Ser/Thr protein kinase)